MNNLLEAKLRASYDTSLSQYLEEIATLQVQLASEEAFSSDRGHLALQNASLQEEDLSLSQENYTLLAGVFSKRSSKSISKCWGLLPVELVQPLARLQVNWGTVQSRDDLRCQRKRLGRETCQCGWGKRHIVDYVGLLIEGLLP
jgi:hypothetical protein